ncbi:MAG: S8 family serine peptidase, partial [Clostridium sp.]
TQTKSFAVASDEESVVINIYKTILPDISITIKDPSGMSSGVINIQDGYFQGSIGRNRYDIYVAGPKPFELEREIQITLVPITLDYLVEGLWNIEINVVNDYEGRYALWLPILEGLNPQTKFLEPTNLNTLGIPATVDNIIAVGSYNPQTNTLSSFSGRGTEYNGYSEIRPDLVAPGENIAGPIPNGGYDKKTGTSMAAPQVTGICALFTEWGLVKGNDPYLYGQRLKYYLVKAANRSRIDIDYPNPSWGYGKVCAFDSFYLLENTLNAILSQRYKSIKNNNNQTRITNYSQESFQGLLDDIEKYGVNKDEIIAFLIEYSNKEELDVINRIPDTTAIPLSEFYAVVHVPLKYLNELKTYAKQTIIYYNPPVYTLTALSPIEASGAPLFADNPYLRLDGTGILVAVIDTGIDYLNEEFMLEDDTTRIVRILDQTIEGVNQNIKGNPIFGTQYTEDQINEAIKLYKQGGDPYTIVPSKDENGHGTMTAGIIGGRGRNPDLRGAAPNCKFVIVKLKQLPKAALEYSGIKGDAQYVYGEPDLLLAIRYISLLEGELKLPIVIYFPLGTNVGAHEGTGAIESNFDFQSSKVGIIPVTGTGNQGDTQTHTEGRIQDENGDNYIEIKIGKNQQYLNFNIYFSKPDKVAIGIVSPSGEVLEKVDIKLRKIKDYKFIYEGTTVSIYYLDPFIETGDEVAVLKFRDIREGIWKIRLYAEKIIEGKYWAWMPQRELLDKDTRFINPIQTTTLTVPATSSGVVASAYYNQDLNTTVSSSGRGYTKDGRIKPDIAAGGINATVIKPGGGTTVATGSSVASAVLAGCCALILQWAITDKNDPGITQTTLITYIIGGARMREGDTYPNKEWGYGILDVQNIFNSLRSTKRINTRISADVKYIEFDSARKGISEEYKEFNIGRLFLRIPK